MIEGYLLKEKLHYDDRFDVYRAVYVLNNQQVLLKLTHDTHPSAKDVSLLQHEYQILKPLQIDGVIKVYELVQNGMMALVFENVEGESLQSYLDNRPVELDNFFNLALVMVNVIEKLHENNVIYKNLSSSSVFINDGTIKLLDFSASIKIAGESQEYPSEKASADLSSYTAPEQTGRVNRPIDYRTDYYSLGVIFFEMLTGRLPFQSNDRLELMHYIIAKPPPLVTEYNSTIPPTLAAIVSKLLAKMSEERYTSGVGLKADLLECQRQWKEYRQIQSFPIGQKDINDHLSISHRLYGRKK